MNTLTIQKLRQEMGAKVRVLHFRYVYESPYLKNKTKLMSLREIREIHAQEFIIPEGGSTRIEVLLNDKEYVSETVCSKKDSFCRKTALQIVCGRLRAQLEEEKSFERANWIKITPKIL